MAFFSFFRPKSNSSAVTVTKTESSFELSLLKCAMLAAGAGNVAISPLGIRAALALAMLGASGTTKTEFGQVLFGSSGGAETIERAFAEGLQKLLQLTDSEHAGMALTLASSLWTSPRFAPAPDFVAQVRARFQAEVDSLDFTAPTAAPTINNWVQQHTQGRIPTIVSAEELCSSPPELLLLSAVYFQARWGSTFDPDATRPGWFRQANGNKQEVPFMHQASSAIGYLAGDGWQAVSMTYSGFPSRASMLVFLPDKPDGLPTLVAGLNPNTWAKWQHSFTEPDELIVDLTIPRFRLEWNADLVPMLRQTGLIAPFTPDADFSAMGFRAEEGGGYIASVRHKTYLQVDEHGTEAAAVTTIMWMAGGAPEPRIPRRVMVKVDSPFFYAIVDNQDGALLFAGTVNDLAHS